MYMGVILWTIEQQYGGCAPHVYGGDPLPPACLRQPQSVLPMYMGVIPFKADGVDMGLGAPHVYGGDPLSGKFPHFFRTCSPCIWG